jgi:hypothetical protein
MPRRTIANFAIQYDDDTARSDELQNDLEKYEYLQELAQPSFGVNGAPLRTVPALNSRSTCRTLVLTCLRGYVSDWSSAQTERANNHDDSANIHSKILEVAGTPRTCQSAELLNQVSETIKQAIIRQCLRNKLPNKKNCLP